MNRRTAAEGCRLGTDLVGFGFEQGEGLGTEQGEGLGSEQGEGLETERGKIGIDPEAAP